MPPIGRGAFPVAVCAKNNAFGDFSFDLGPGVAVTYQFADGGPLASPGIDMVELEYNRIGDATATALPAAQVSHHPIAIRTANPDVPSFVLGPLAVGISAVVLAFNHSMTCAAQGTQSASTG